MAYYPPLTDEANNLLDSLSISVQLLTSNTTGQKLTLSEMNYKLIALYCWLTGYNLNEDTGGIFYNINITPKTPKETLTSIIYITYQLADWFELERTYTIDELTLGRIIDLLNLMNVKFERITFFINPLGDYPYAEDPISIYFKDIYIHQPPTYDEADGIFSQLHYSTPYSTLTDFTYEYWVGNYQPYCSSSCDTYIQYGGMPCYSEDLSIHISIHYDYCHNEHHTSFCEYCNEPTCCDTDHFYCDICDACFSEDSVMHYDENHKSYYVCEHCGARFEEYDSYVMHIEPINNGNGHCYNCPASNGEGNCIFN